MKKKENVKQDISRKSTANSITLHLHKSKQKVQDGAKTKVDHSVAKIKLMHSKSIKKLLNFTDEKFASTKNKERRNAKHFNTHDNANNHANLIKIVTNYNPKQKNQVVASARVNNKEHDQDNTKHRMKLFLTKLFKQGTSSRRKLKTRNAWECVTGMRAERKEEADESGDCVTVIEHDCDNNYSLIYQSLSGVL